MASSWLHDPSDSDAFGDRDDYERMRADDLAEHVDHMDLLRRERLAEHAPVDFKAPPRVIEDREGWEQLRRAKLAACRVCGDSWLPQLHHLVSRSLLGDDVPDNLVALCSDCHMLVEHHDAEACASLGAALTERERAYVTGKKSAEYLQRRYPNVKEAA